MELRRKSRRSDHLRRWSALLMASAWLVQSVLGEVPPSAVSVSVTGLTNVFSISERYYSGNAPESAESFAALKRLGIKTIISVDGAEPDVKEAAEFGLTYVHLPFGYGGIPQTNVLRLIKAAQTLPGPIYLHCHHGLHRGPAAMAVICEGTLGWTTNEAVAWMRLAGTGAEYQGLYKAATEFAKPTPAELGSISAEFPQISPPTKMVEAMVEIDKHWTAFKTLRKKNFAVKDEAERANLANEATLLREGFKELQRDTTAQSKGSDFLKRLAECDALMRDFRISLGRYTPAPDGTALIATPENLALSERLLGNLGQSCSACHKQHRN